MKATLVFRLFAVILLPLFCIHVSAQLYRVESLVSNVIFTKDKPASFIDRSNEKGYRIPNGTEIQVLSRVVHDTIGSHAILAEIAYKDKHYYTEARWLVFSGNNEKGVKDIFADDDFSPSAPELMGISLMKLDPHSSWGRFLYSYIPPVCLCRIASDCYCLVGAESQTVPAGIVFLSFGSHTDIFECDA